jgi:hypothetical protein
LFIKTPGEILSLIFWFRIDERKYRGEALANRSQRFKEVFGGLAFLLMGIHSGYQLVQWYSSGTLWANFRSRGEPNNYELIAYDDHPLNFVGLFGIHVLIVVMSCAGCVLLIRRLRL